MSLGIIDRCEQAATTWISKNFHDPESYVHNKKRSQQKSPVRPWKRQICSTHEDVLSPLDSGCPQDVMVFNNLRKVWNNLENWKKKKHASPVGEMGAGAGVPTGSFMLCLENSCSGEQCIWLKGAPDKAGAWVDAHSPFLFPDWTTVLHIFFFKGHSWS